MAQLDNTAKTITYNQFLYKPEIKPQPQIVKRNGQIYTVLAKDQNLLEYFLNCQKPKSQILDRQDEKRLKDLQTMIEEIPTKNRRRKRW